MHTSSCMHAHSKRDRGKVVVHSFFHTICAEQGARVHLESAPMQHNICAPNRATLAAIQGICLQSWHGEGMHQSRRNRIISPCKLLLLNCSRLWQAVCHIAMPKKRSQHYPKTLDSMQAQLYLSFGSRMTRVKGSPWRSSLPSAG